MKRPDIPVLTALRFPAAYAIVLYHFLAYTPTPVWIWDGFNAGVSFFYVLSGFILYYNYDDLKDRGFFWVARFARIWPVHLVTLVMVLVLEPWDRLLGHASWQLTLPANILLIHAWLPFKGSALSFNGVSWSLSVEAFFYLCFPWLVAGLMRDRAAWLLAGSFTLGLAIVIGADLFWPSNASYFSNFNPVCRVFEFILGMVTCRLWFRHRREEPTSRSWLGFELVSIVLALGLVVGIPCLLLGLGLTSATPAWIGSEVCALGFAVLVWVFAHQGGAISRFLSHRSLVWLGEISFALYMCHQFILRLLIGDQIQTTEKSIQIFLIAVTLALLLSAAIFHLVETPARHAIVGAYKKHRLRSHPANAK